MPNNAMNETHIDPEARQGRFSARFAYHDSPEILEQLERAAVSEATSAASIVRSAVRVWLRQHEVDERA